MWEQPQYSTPRLKFGHGDMLLTFLKRLLREIPEHTGDNEDPKSIISSIREAWRQEQALKWMEKRIHDVQLRLYYKTIDAMLRNVDDGLKNLEPNPSHKVIILYYMTEFQARVTHIEEHNHRKAKLKGKSHRTGLKGSQLNEPTQEKAPATETNVLFNSQSEAPVSGTTGYALKFATIPIQSVDTMTCFITTFPQVLQESEIDGLFMAAAEIMSKEKNKKVALRYVRHATVLQHARCATSPGGLERFFKAIQTKGAGWKAEFDKDVKSNFKKVCKAVASGRKPGM